MGLRELTAMSNRYGADARYVLAGGGNTSCKEDGVLYVKGSGTSLQDILPEQFVAMDLERLTGMLRKEYPQGDGEREAAALADMMAARLPGEERKRPSVEAVLHAIFPQKYVLHTHPALVNGLSCGGDGAQICRELFGNTVVWVPLTKPGYVLARACADAFAAHEREYGVFPRTAILQNHGVFVAGDTAQDVDSLMAGVMERLERRLKEQPETGGSAIDRERACALAPALRMLYRGDETACAVFWSDGLAQSFVRDADAMRPLMRPFTPDHIVYCKHSPLFVSPEDDLRGAFDAYTERNGFAPKIVAVQGLGFYALGRGKKEAETAKALFVDAMKVAVYARSFGGINPLPDDFTQFILNWEAESYRQKAALSASSPGRLSGKIAIVTGSAQGFGKGIAEAMAAEGAYVVVADLSGEGARACADGLERRHGAGTALAVEANVSDEASVRAMVQDCVLAYGGLDILVSNAGILRAGGLEDITKEQFEQVTSVNYTGYFLCAKYAAIPMKIQRGYNPAYTSDIIEINSKSGLAGSNRNFTYAGSKFGGIGLTQSFALELVGDGIKVNAVCPGNLLDGPLWSDPERGLFRQYLDAGKVPGAKTVGDVRRFYEAKVPMNRGCSIPDVVRAILYAVEQQYETGQAIPVTGGQVMLS